MSESERESARQIKELEALARQPGLPRTVAADLAFSLRVARLKPLQTALRRAVSHEALTIEARDGKGQMQREKEADRTNMLERHLVDRHFYTRARILPMHDRKGTKTLEKYESQMRTGQEQRKRAQHKEFLQELAAHARDFWDYHKKKMQILKKRAAQVKAHVDTIGKKEQHDKDRYERERIKALKANEIERYMEMVNSAKNSRLIEILDQTHTYLLQLGARVMEQKRENEILASNKDANGKNAGMPMIVGEGEIKEEKDKDPEAEKLQNAEPEGMGMKEGICNGTKEYYNITHTILEEIKEDPKTLQGGKLKSYQIQGLEWMVSLYNNCLNGILADEMGLGKTIQTIALFCYLIEKKDNDGPFLVVVPLSTITNWIVEFDKWAPHIKKMIYKGDPATRKCLGAQMRTEKFNVVLTTYDYVMKDRTVLNRIAWQYIVVDEGHRMKNYKCKFAMTLGQHYQSAHRLLLTGTPLQNNLAELWALLNFLLPKIFACCEDFEKWFNRPFAKFGMEREIPLNEEERLLVINRLHQVLRPFLLRRMKKEVEQELPNKVEYVIKVDLSGWQKIYYNQLKEHGMLARDPSTGKIGSRSLMNTMMQLRKICNHPYLFLSGYSDDFLMSNISKCSGKFELLDRILPKLTSNGHKILIFSQMTQLMDIMQYYFNIKGLRHLRLDGTTKADDRGTWTHLFNSEGSDYKIFLLSTRAGGLGLNLQAADTVIIFDSDFNPQMDLQAQDRAHRIGQKHEVRVYRLVTSTRVEEEILSRAAMKKNLDDVVIQAGLFNQKASDTERRKKLEDLLRRDEGVVDEEDDSVPDDEQINEMLARNEHEFAVYQKIDQDRYANEGKDKRTQEIMTRLNLTTLPKNFNYRLMQEYEVPAWVTAVPMEEKKEIITGKRMRKRINYADDITERQWEKCIEEGKDPNEEVERLREMKEQRKRKKLETAVEAEQENSSSLLKEEEQDSQQEPDEKPQEQDADDIKAEPEEQKAGEIPASFSSGSESMSESESSMSPSESSGPNPAPEMSTKVRIKRDWNFDQVPDEVTQQQQPMAVAEDGSESASLDNKMIRVTIKDGGNVVDEQQNENEGSSGEEYGKPM